MHLVTGSRLSTCVSPRTALKAAPSEHYPVQCNALRVKKCKENL